MASIQRAAEKPAGQQMPADQSRVMAGHMLTLDYLVQGDMTERQIARKVVRKNIIRSAGCLTLPLTIMYFGAYVMSTRLHEDITNVFFLESGIRSRTDGMFEGAATVEDVWHALRTDEPNNFLDVFFNQKDMFGNELAMNITENNWGDRGLVIGYNQIQGAVRISQSRSSLVAFNKPWNCTNELTCGMCECNKGWQTRRSFTQEPPKNPDCGDHSYGRCPEAGRRLSIVRPELRTSFPAAAKDEEDEFVFWLFPSEDTEVVRARLNYYWERGWLDENTTRMAVKMYIMNAELGRTRLEQLVLWFYFSEAGSIYYQRNLESIFLQFWYGGMSMSADFSFFMLLLMTTAYRVWQMWGAFLRSKLFFHLMNLGTAWEWLLIMAGWWGIFGFYRQRTGEALVVEKLKPVHERGWMLTGDDEDKIVEFFDAATLYSVVLAGLRVMYAQYSVVLMFRFFVSFSTQPRLAIVLKTMKNVLTDVVHFGIVFLPSFMAYVIAGSLLFGRTMEEFATIQGSFGTVFRIAMESEYEWADLSEQYYLTAAMWAWTFMILVVLLFLNMVVAIILDIYNETRESSFPGEAIWETISTVFLRLRKCRSWVPNKQLEDFFGNGHPELAMFTRRHVEEKFENMPEGQKNLFFASCKTEMKWESAKDLSKKSLLRLTGTVMDALDHAHETVRKVTEEESENPLHSWVNPVHGETAHYSEDGSLSRAPPPVAAPAAPEAKKVRVDAEDENPTFLANPIMTKGGKQPLLSANREGVRDSYSASGPDWLQEAWMLLRQQRDWIAYANWNLEQMQWQIQKAHESKLKDAPADKEGAKVL